MAIVQDSFNPFASRIYADGKSIDRATFADQAMGEIARKFPAHADTMNILQAWSNAAHIGTRFQRCDTDRLIADLKPWKPSSEQPTIVHALADKLGAGSPGMLSVFAAISDAVYQLDKIKPANQTFAGAKAVTEVQESLLRTGHALNSVAGMGFATPDFFKAFRNTYHEVREGLKLQEHPSARELALATAVADTIRSMRKLPRAEADKALMDKADIGHRIRLGQGGSMDAYSDTADLLKERLQRLAVYDTAQKQADAAVTAISANAGKFDRHQDKPFAEVDPRQKLNDMLPVAANERRRTPAVA